MSRDEYPYYEKLLTNMYDIRKKYNHISEHEFISGIYNVQEPKKCDVKDAKEK